MHFQVLFISTVFCNRLSGAVMVFTFLVLTVKVLVATIDAQWEGMGDVGSARYEPALHPPMPDHKGFKLQ